MKKLQLKQNLKLMRRNIRELIEDQEMDQIKIITIKTFQIKKKIISIKTIGENIKNLILSLMVL